MLVSNPVLAAGLCVVGGYLLGSIPFGVIATRLGGAGDVRQIGSGNIGATNVLRTGRRDLAAITLIGDGGKGAAGGAAGRLAAGAAPRCAALAGGAAFLGHLFPVWLKLQGRQGRGDLLRHDARDRLAGRAAGRRDLARRWRRIFRISSLAALTAAALAPLYVFLTGQTPEAKLWLAVFMAVLIFIRHHENIGRLLKGEEPRIGAKAASRQARRRPAMTPERERSDSDLRRAARLAAPGAHRDRRPGRLPAT